MKKCPSCDNNNVKICRYEDGAILICGDCRLQWAEYADSFRRKANCADAEKSFRGGITEYYMSSDSIASSERYLPYKLFFKYLKEKKPIDPLRILDIGCGNGLFLQECLRLGHDAVGVEADDTLKKVISPRLLDKIIFSPVEDVETFGQPFDVITFWDSFEHLENSFELLDRLKTYLKKDGIIYLRVNNNYDIANLVTLLIFRLCPPVGKRMLWLCFGFPHHAWNFSKTGMHNMLAKKGWQVNLCRFSDTPASRVAKNMIFRAIISVAYLVNRMMRGGKIGEYYIAVS